MTMATMMTTLMQTVEEKFKFLLMDLSHLPLLCKKSFKIDATPQQWCRWRWWAQRQQQWWQQWRQQQWPWCRLWKRNLNFYWWMNYLKFLYNFFTIFLFKLMWLASSAIHFYRILLIVLLGCLSHFLHFGLDVPLLMNQIPFKHEQNTKLLTRKFDQSLVIYQTQLGKYFFPWQYPHYPHSPYIHWFFWISCLCNASCLDA